LHYALKDIQQFNSFLPMETKPTKAILQKMLAVRLAIAALFISGAFSFATGQTITTIAGDTLGYGGDAGPAVKASLNYPSAVAVNARGNIFISDENNDRLRMVDGKTGIIITLAGTGTGGFSGDNGPAADAQINGPSGIAFDKEGNIYFADECNARIRRIDIKTRVITTVAGNGLQAYSGDGGPAADASFIHPSGLAIDAAGNMYIADWGSNTIRKIDAVSGNIITIAGSGEPGSGGDGGLAKLAKLNGVNEVAVDNKGNLYMTDSYNNRVRRIDLKTGIIYTVAGTGDMGYSGDGAIGTDAEVSGPTGVTTDTAGNVFFCDWGNSCVRRIDYSTGVITTVAGRGEAGHSGDGGPAVLAYMSKAEGVAVDAQGNLYIADDNNNRIRKVEAALQIPVIGYNPDNSDMLMYPNPASNNVSVVVNAPLQQGATFSCYDIMGREMWSVPAEANAKIETLDTSALTAGVYLLRMLQPDGNESVKRLVVKR